MPGQQPVLPAAAGCAQLETRLPPEALLADAQGQGPPPHEHSTERPGQAAAEPLHVGLEVVQARWGGRAEGQPVEGLGLLWRQLLLLRRELQLLRLWLTSRLLQLPQLQPLRLLLPPLLLLGLPRLRLLLLHRPLPLGAKPRRRRGKRPCPRACR